MVDLSTTGTRGLKLQGPSRFKWNRCLKDAPQFGTNKDFRLHWLDLICCDTSSQLLASYWPALASTGLWLADVTTDMWGAPVNVHPQITDVYPRGSKQGTHSVLSVMGQYWQTQPDYSDTKSIQDSRKRNDLDRTVLFDGIWSKKVNGIVIYIESIVGQLHDLLLCRMGL